MNRSRSRAWSALVPLLAVVAFVGVVALASGGEDPVPQPDPGATLAKVAADPDAYDNRQLVFSGTVAEIVMHGPKRFRGAFVLTGAQGGRLLVVPSAGRRTGLRPHDAIEVRGIVRALDPVSDKRGAAKMRDELVKSTDSQAAVKAVLIRTPSGSSVG
jgi:hypothetical protein